LRFIPLLLCVLFSWRAVAADRQVFVAAMGIERTPWSSGQWRWWHNGKHSPDVKDANGRRDICSHVFYPAIGLYDAADPAYIEYRCQLLKMCGIDGISLSAYPRDEWVDRALKTSGEYLNRYGIKATTRVQSMVTIDQLDFFLHVLGPATWRIDGRPVLTFFSPGIKPNELLAWKNKYPAETRPLVFKWASSTVDPRWKGILDGAYDWCGDDRRHPHRTDVKPYNRYFGLPQVKTAYHEDVDRAKQILRDGIITYYMDGVSPGFDNLGVNGWGKELIKCDRENGQTYEWRWQQAIANPFSLVLIPTWDDWGENTTIEPTVEYGNQYLEITRKYAAKYKGVAPSEGNLSVPEWIYKIRKMSADPQILDQTTHASTLIQHGNYLEAEKIVRPIFEKLPPPTGKYFDPLEATKH